MKKLIFSFFVIFAVTIVQAQQADNLKSKSYQMNFVFTGEVKNQTDSTFVLEYSLPQENIKNYRALALETSKGRQRIDLSGKSRVEGIDIKTVKDRVNVVISNYDKYDFPVIVEAEDNRGTIHPLFLQGKRGGYMTSGQLKEQVRKLHEMMIRTNAGHQESQ